MRKSSSLAAAALLLQTSGQVVGLYVDPGLRDEIQAALHGQTVSEMAKVQADGARAVPVLELDTETDDGLTSSIFVAISNSRCGAHCEAPPQANLNGEQLEDGSLVKRGPGGGKIDSMLEKTAKAGARGGLNMMKKNPKTTALLGAGVLLSAGYGLLKTHIRSNKTVDVYHRRPKGEGSAGDEGVARVKRGLAGEDGGESLQKRGLFVASAMEGMARKAYQHASKGGNYLKEHPKTSVAAAVGAVAMGGYGLLNAHMAAHQKVTVIDHGGDDNGKGGTKEHWSMPNHALMKRAVDEAVLAKREPLIVPALITGGGFLAGRKVGKKGAQKKAAKAVKTHKRSLSSSFDGNELGERSLYHDSIEGAPIGPLPALSLPQRPIVA